MIDLHMHILPGLDDGAGRMEESVIMARKAVDCGVETVAATSHAYLPGMDTEQYLRKYKKTFNDFRRKLKQEQVELDVRPGMEIFVRKEIVTSLREGKLLTLNGSRYPLIEFSFDVSEELIGLTVKKLIRAGYMPLLAHPERYDCVKNAPDIVRKWYQEGAVLQINKGSILGHFGHRVQRAAHWILGHRLAGIVASDAHNMYDRTTNLDELVNVLEFTYGIGSVDLLLEENPMRILQNAEVIRLG